MSVCIQELNLPFLDPSKKSLSTIPCEDKTVKTPLLTVSLVGSVTQWFGALFLRRP